MKAFIKINLVGLLLGFIFYLTLMLLFEEYHIQQELNTSKNVFSIFLIAMFLFMPIAIPLITSRWLNGSKWSLLLSLLWIPYFIICIILKNSLFPPSSSFDEDNNGAGLISIFLLIGYPFYILILSFIGIIFRKVPSKG